VARWPPPETATAMCCPRPSMIAPRRHGPIARARRHEIPVARYQGMRPSRCAGAGRGDIGPASASPRPPLAPAPCLSESVRADGVPTMTTVRSGGSRRRISLPPSFAVPASVVRSSSAVRRRGRPPGVVGHRSARPCACRSVTSRPRLCRVVSRSRRARLCSGCRVRGRPSA
jgi:hypothetical protein